MRATGIRYRHLKPKSPKKFETKGGYGSRNEKLDQLGYSGYKEYLKSDIWKALRDERLRRFPNCTFCGCKATEVHHYCYHKLVLLGCMNALLFPVCSNCHEEIEFTGGRKNSLRESQDKLISMLKDRGQKRLIAATFGAFARCLAYEKNQHLTRDERIAEEKENKASKRKRTKRKRKEKKAGTTITGTPTSHPTAFPCP
jgi:hypothetical protein